MLQDTFLEKFKSFNHTNELKHDKTVIKVISEVNFLSRIF